MPAKTLPRKQGRKTTAEAVGGVSATAEKVAGANSPDKRHAQQITSSVGKNESTKRLLRDERGMTIVELLTALTIVGMVCSILLSFLFMGVSMYKRMTADSQIRNHGDAIVSQVISELKDAIYAAQGESSNEIVFVRRALAPDGSFDNESYVAGFKMRIESVGESDRFGIGVYAVEARGETLVKRFDLPSPYTLEAPDDSPAEADPQGLTVVHDRLVDVRLRYVKRAEAVTKTAEIENPGYELHTRIPLFRAG